MESRIEIKGRDLLNGVPKEITHHARPDRRSAAGAGQPDHRSGEGRAGSDAAGTCGRHRRQGHRADRRRRAAGESGPGVARRNGAAGLDRGRAAVLRRAGHRQGAGAHQHA